MPHNAIEHLSDLYVSLIIDGYDLAAWPVLALLVGYLPYVLRQLVDGQRRAGVDRLTLHRTAGCQNVSRPLPVVVG